MFVSDQSQNVATTELSARLRLLRRRRQSRLLRSAISMTAWLAACLLGVALVVASILTLSA